jgi:hypothetical protein
MQFDTKIAVVIRTDLEAWQKLNVAAFLAGGIAATFPESVGEPYEDGSGTSYLSLIGQPILIYGAGYDQAQTVWMVSCPGRSAARRPSRRGALQSRGRNGTRCLVWSRFCEQREERCIAPGTRRSHCRVKTPMRP